MDATASRRVFGGRGPWWPRTGVLAGLVLAGLLVQGCSDNNGRVTGTQTKVTGDAVGASVRVSVTINPGAIDRGRRGSVVVIVSSPNGFPLGGRRVDLSSLGGRLDATTGITDGNGRFTTQVFIPCETGAGTITVTAFADNQSAVAATATAAAVTSVSNDPCAGIAGTPVNAGGGGGTTGGGTTGGGTTGGGTPLPTITISAPDSTITESVGDTATVTFSRNPGSASALQVFFAVGGSATSGCPSPGDFTVSPSGAVTIPASAVSASITITPCATDGGGEPAETVVITIASDPAYTGSGSAIVTINE